MKRIRTEKTIKTIKTGIWVTAAFAMSILWPLIIAMTAFFLTGCGSSGKNSKNAGELVITYQITDEEPSEEAVADTVDKVSKRLETYDKDALVELGDENTLKVTLHTKGVSKELLQGLTMSGNVELVVEEEYEKFKNQKDYTASITTEQIETAEAKTVENGDTKVYGIELKLDEEGTELFAELTKERIGETIYILYDGKVLLSPKVRAPITDGTVMISGGFANASDAENVASCIRSGSLPLTLKLKKFEAQD